MSFLLSLVVSFLMLAGAACALLAAVGILRMPDLFTRLQASSKAATLGAILVLSAVAVHFQGGPVAVKAVVVILFLALTAPVGAHRIARAAYNTGERMADSGSVDEWAELRAAPSDSPSSSLSPSRPSELSPAASRGNGQRTPSPPIEAGARQ